MLCEISSKETEITFWLVGWLVGWDCFGFLAGFFVVFCDKYIAVCFIFLTTQAIEQA